MARKKKSGGFEDLIDLGSRLPWKYGVILAVVSYFGFHYAAAMQNTTPHELNAMGGFAAKQIIITAATIFQYLLPLAFLIGAAFSVYKGKHREQLLEIQSGIASIKDMSWQDFELLVGEAFRRQGYSVDERGGGAPDGGIDLILRKDGRKSIVQCKRWKTYTINVSLVRELYGVMTAENADNCIFVTSGTYTLDALNFAKSKPIWLIDGDELEKLVRGVQSIKQVAVTPPEITSNLIQSSAPSCPKCGSAMIKRTAKQGANTGNEFWGCATFPKCRGIAPIN